ncbi:MAG: PAS domain S-box protein, partial [Anaerolineales bacterium]|nr:PAS domain S-box protein [Anaerolineales bacterium]
VVISLLVTEQDDFQQAIQVGKSLAGLHYIAPEVLGKSQALLGKELFAGLSDAQQLFIQPRIIKLFVELANGFINASREIVLSEQDQIRSALVSEIQAAELALLEINNELEQRVTARTADLVDANIDLRQEIEKHKRTQAALVESEEKWRSLVKNAPERIITVARDGNILFINRTFPDRTPEEVIGTNFYDWTTPAHKSIVEQAFDTVFRKKKPIRYIIDYTYHEETITFENSFAPVISGGEVTMGILISTDISERERALNALQESEENFSALAENAHDGILITTFEGDYIYSNKRYSEIIGYLPDELQKINLLALSTDEDPVMHKKWIGERYESNRVSHQFESQLINKEGNIIQIESTIAVTTWKGKAAAIAVVRDITERKQAEEILKKRSEEITQLHEKLRVRRVEEQTTLLDFSQSLLGEADRKNVLDKATSAVCEICKADYCEIQLFNEKEQILQLVAGQGWLADFTDDYDIRTATESQAWFTYEEKEPVIVEDISVETRFTPLPHHINHGVKSSLTVPMIVRDQAIGVMSVHWGYKRKIRDSELRILPLIANTTSATLERVRLFESEYRRSQSLTRTNELITALSQTATRLAITLDPDQVMDTVREELKQIGITCAAFLYDQDKLEISSIFTAMEPGLVDQTRIKTGIDLHDPDMLRRFLNKFYGDIIKTKTPIFIQQQIIDQITESSHTDKPTIARALTYVGLSSETPSAWLPLLVKDRVIGTLGLWGKGLEEGDLPAVKVFASQVATAFENAQLFEQIVKSRQRMHNLSNQLVEVQETERRRIARELHDEIGQSLTGLSLLFNSLYRSDEKSSEQYQKVQSLVEELISKTQNLSLELRPAMLDDMGLLPTLIWFIERFETQTGILINFEHKGLHQRFPAPLETTAYRITQEALTNVARYADVEQADVRLWADQETLSIQIEDHGIGFDLEEKQSTGLANGLSGINERVTLLGGDFELISARGSGTTLLAKIPIQQINNESEIHENDNSHRG